MAKLQPYIGGQNYRTVRQHDTTQVLDRLTGQLQAWDKQQQEQEAFDEKIKNIDMQNKTNSAIVNYKSDLKILNDSFDPNSQTPQDHKEKTEELRQSYRENAPFQGDFDDKALLSTTNGAIKVKASHEKHVLDQRNAGRIQEYVGIAEEDSRLRVQRATEIANRAFSDNIITVDKRHLELQGAYMKMITHDATYGDLDDTIKRLGNPKDSKYGDLDAETRKDGLAFALSVRDHRKKAFEIINGVAAFNASKEIGKIITKEGATPEEIHYALAALPLKDDEIKKSQKDYQNSRVSLRTNNTTYRTMNGKVQTLLGKYGTTDAEERVVTNEKTAKRFLQEVKGVQDELLKKHLDGELNYGSYVKLVDQLEPVVAQRIDEARGEIQDNTEWFRFGDKDVEKVFEESAFGGAQERISDAFMNYHNSLSRLDSGDKEARTQYKEDYGKEWENNSAGRKNVVKQIVKEENFRDINSAYKLFSTYGGRDNAAPLDARVSQLKEVPVDGVIYIETADGGLELKP